MSMKFGMCILWIWGHNGQEAEFLILAPEPREVTTNLALLGEMTHTPSGMLMNIFIHQEW